MKYFLAFLMILFASYSDIFLFRIGIVPITPSNFLLPLFILLAFLKYPIKDYWDIIKTPSFKFLLFLLIISIFYTIPSKADPSIITTIISLEVLSILLYLFTFQFFRSEDKKLILVFVTCSFIVLAGSVWYDFFIGLPKYSLDLAQSVRKGGFGENPNQAASGIKFLGLGLLLFIHKNNLLKTITIFFLVTTIFLTFSRSGTVSIVIILILGTMNNWQPKFKLTLLGQFKSLIKIVFLFSMIYILLLSFAEVIKREFPAFTRGAAGARMELLLGNSDEIIFEKDDDNELSRTGLFKKYLNDFMNNPFGFGTGYSSDKAFNRLKTHNYFLYMAVDFGIIGLLVFIVFLIGKLIASYRENQYYYLIFTILLIIEGLISHSIFIERSLLISLAFFDSQIYLNKNVLIPKEQS